MRLLKYAAFLVAVLLLGGALSFGLSSVGLWYFADPITGVVAVGPLLFVSWLSYRGAVQITESITILGLPLGLVSMLMGLSNSTLVLLPEEISMGSLEQSPINLSYTLLGALYGGFASLIGYLFRPEKIRSDVNRISKIDFIIVCIGILVCWLFPWTLGLSHIPSISTYISIPAFSILGLVCMMALYSGHLLKKSVCKSLSEASVYTAVIGVLIGLIQWLSSGLNPTVQNIQFSTLMMLYSLILYIFTYLYSVYINEVKKPDYMKKNWHLAEASSFYLFLIFAPISISDYLYNEKENIEQRAVENELRKEINNLSERLAALEKLS